MNQEGIRKKEKEWEQEEGGKEAGLKCFLYST